MTVLWSGVGKNESNLCAVSDGSWRIYPDTAPIWVSSINGISMLILRDFGGGGG